jgi:hypothetical protein
MNYRNLFKPEIAALRKQGCSAADWSMIQVKEGFSTSGLKNVQFNGQVQLGIFDGNIEISKGISKPCGLYNCYIQDCTIGNHTCISDVKNLAGYNIGDYVAIENISTIVVNGETMFGNGLRIEILNEGGGRETPLFDKLTSQIAYLFTNYRHDNVLIGKLNKLVNQYIESKRSSRGIIEEGVRITNCNQIKNVNIGKHAVINGALHLEEGTIVSNEYDPVFIGEGVIAKKFIILSGSRVDGSSIIDKTFVGQSVKIGKQFSAENSAFFANSEGFHGEALSIFAGPYTVTHHKSTLLIAGLFSFYNAGSGSNQSNHMYKLGPVHQGILERGVKTGSFSYMMWPCRVGAFTGVIGKHYANFDTTDLPFSYILESNGRSLLMPAMNLCTVGTRRDSTKWPDRDRRKDPYKSDLLNFELFTPCTIGKILQGMELLIKIEKDSSDNDGFIDHNGVTIMCSKIKQGYEKYEMAVKIFTGQQIIKQFEEISHESSFKLIREKLCTHCPEALGRWIDMSGMLAPGKVIEKLIDSINKEQLVSLDDLVKQLKIIHNDYNKYAWAWCLDIIEKRYKISFKEITRKQLEQIISDWKDSMLKYNELVLQDAHKEFSEKSRIGYGIDGDKDIRNKDFEAVLGKYEENKFVSELNKELENIKEKAVQIILKIKELKED